MKKFLPVLLILPILLIADAAPEWGLVSIRKPKTKASSILKEAKKTYPSENAIDGNVTTAWCEGKKDFGKGETWEVEFPPTVGSGLSVFPGFGGSKKLYENNNRIKDYEITLTIINGRTKKITGFFEDGLCGFPDHRECNAYDMNSTEYEDCEKRMNSLCYWNDYNQGGQIRFPKAYCVTKVQFKIISVYPGRKHNDTCISELQLFRPVDRFPQETEDYQALEKTCK